MNFPATPHLAPVARRVAACGPICGLQVGKWGTGYHPAHLGACWGDFQRTESKAAGYGFVKG